MNPLSTPYGYWDIERRLLLFLIPCSYGYSTLSASKSSARFLPLDRVCEARSGSGSGTCSFSAPPTQAGKDLLVGSNHDPAPKSFLTNLRDDQSWNMSTNWFQSLLIIQIVCLRIMHKNFIIMGQNSKLRP